jgi:hypothetical protein
MWVLGNYHDGRRNASEVIFDHPHGGYVLTVWTSHTSQHAADDRQATYLS